MLGEHLMKKQYKILLGIATLIVCYILANLIDIYSFSKKDQ